jgi:hypothetical protein
MATMINTKSNLFKKALGINNTSSNESSDSEDVPRGEYLSNLPKAQVVIPKGLASFLIQRNDPKPIEIDQVDTLQEFDFCQSLDTVLCGKEVPPKEQIKWFVKLMKRTKQDSDKLKIIRILQKIKDKDLWNEFYAQKGAPVLFNWATTPFILNSEQNSYAMLCIIRLLPYQAEIFDQCKFHKFVTKKIKSGTQGIF